MIDRFQFEVLNARKRGSVTAKDYRELCGRFDRIGTNPGLRYEHESFSIKGDVVNARIVCVLQVAYGAKFLVRLECKFEGLL